MAKSAADRLTSATDGHYPGTVGYDSHGNTIALGPQTLGYDGADRHYRIGGESAVLTRNDILFVNAHRPHETLATRRVRTTIGYAG